MFSLSIRRHQQPAEEYILRHDIVTVGRNSENDIQLADTTVSQHHARFLVSQDTLMIEDLGSTNGTYVNGQRIKKQRLNRGDLVMIGQHHLSFHDLRLDGEELEHEPTLQMSCNSIEQLLFEPQVNAASTSSGGDSKAINWVAQDQNGIWWGFEQQPVAESEGWSNFQDTMKLKLKQETPNPGWRQTLHKV